MPDNHENKLTDNVPSVPGLSCPRFTRFILSPVYTVYLSPVYQKPAIGLISPYSDNDLLRRYEDGCKLQRYKNIWFVEPTKWLDGAHPLVAGAPRTSNPYPPRVFCLACLWIKLKIYS